MFRLRLATPGATSRTASGSVGCTVRAMCSLLAPYSMASTASRVRSVVGWWGVQADGQMPPVPREVLVRSEDRRMGTVGERAEQHVDRRPDDAVRAARVEERRCAIIVTELDGEHCECGEALPERFEVGLALHAREHLLPDRTGQHGLPAAHQRCPLVDDALLSGAQIVWFTTQRARPDG